MTPLCFECNYWRVLSYQDFNTQILLVTKKVRQMISLTIAQMYPDQYTRDEASCAHGRSYCAGCGVGESHMERHGD